MWKYYPTLIISRASLKHACVRSTALDVRVLRLSRLLNWSTDVIINTDVRVGLWRKELFKVLLWKTLWGVNEKHLYVLVAQWDKRNLQSLGWMLFWIVWAVVSEGGEGIDCVWRPNISQVSLYCQPASDAEASHCVFRSSARVLWSFNLTSVCWLVSHIVSCISNMMISFTFRFPCGGLEGAGGRLSLAQRLKTCSVWS